MADPGMVESHLWRIKSVLGRIDAVSYQRSPVWSGLDDRDLETLFDHLENADEAALVALRTGCPSQVFDPDSRAFHEMERRYRLEQPESREQLQNQLADALLLIGAIRYLADHDAVPGEKDPATFWAALEETQASLEASIHLLDPSWFSSRLADENDPDERIQLAARIEGHETTNERMREINAGQSLVTKASASLLAVEERDGELGSDLRHRLGDGTLALEEVIPAAVAAGIPEPQARVLAAFLRM
ncbi:MAG: hypothetical protein WD206_10150 [Actinomycetota bacterium]